MRQNINRYNTITFTPHWMQLFVSDMPIVLLCLCCFVYAGLSFLPFGPFVGVCSSLLFLTLLYRYFFLRSVKFRISGEQLIHERGIFKRDVDYIELYRIVDFCEQQSFVQRLSGIKTVVVHSGDRTTPCLHMAGMLQEHDIVGIIRERVEYNKRVKGVYEITNR